MANDTSVKQDTRERTERTGGGQEYRPQVDLIETNEELILVADVPGVKSEAIDVDFEDGVLTIQGKVEPRYGETRRFLLREYGIGDFHRTFRVSEQVNVAGIHAECADGVLTVHLPKAESARPRKIEVKSAG